MFRRSGLRTVASRLNSTRPSRGGPHPDGRSTAERLLFGLEPQERYGPYIPLKWFMLNKGYGFLEPEDGSADVSCHLSAVRASSRDTLPEGAAVTRRRPRETRETEFVPAGATVPEVGHTRTTERQGRTNPVPHAQDTRRTETRRHRHDAPRSVSHRCPLDSAACLVQHRATSLEGSTAMNRWELRTRIAAATSLACGRSSDGYTSSPVVSDPVRAFASRTPAGVRTHRVQDVCVR